MIFFGLLSNALRGDNAIEYRQIEIDEDQVEVFARCNINRLLPVACFQDAVTKSFKTFLEQHACVVVVFHDHDCACVYFVRHFGNSTIFIHRLHRLFRMAIMKSFVVMGLGISVLVCLACNSKPGTNNAPATASPSTASDFKALFFADQTLQQISEIAKPTAPAGPNDPWPLFASALAASRQGNTDQAKTNLKKILDIPDGESRVQLWAWKALRDLGEKPPADIADQIQGVVCELHNETGVGTIAAYVDGRARWHGGQDKVIVWDAAGTDATIDRHIYDLLKAAEPLVNGAPLSNEHKTPEPAAEHFRVSILTFGGIRTVEVFGPEIVEDHPVAPVLLNSVKLLDALTKKGQK